MIRYQNSSEMCRKLAESVRVMKDEIFKKKSKIFIFVIYFKNIISRDSNLFDFRQNDPAPVLLILDRREDPITPLLNQVNKYFKSILRFTCFKK